VLVSINPLIELKKIKVSVSVTLGRCEATPLKVYFFKQSMRLPQCHEK